MFCICAMCETWTRSRIIDALLHGMDRIAVKVRGPLLELGKILHRAQAALGAVDLLVEQAPQADGIEPHAPLLGAVIRIQMELRRRMPVDMAVQAGNPQAGGRDSCGHRSD